LWLLPVWLHWLQCHCTILLWNDNGLNNRSYLDYKLFFISFYLHENINRKIHYMSIQWLMFSQINDTSSMRVWIMRKVPWVMLSPISGQYIPISLEDMGFLVLFPSVLRTWNGKGDVKYGDGGAGILRGEAYCFRV